MSEILNLKDLKVYYPIRSGFFNRVTDNVLAVDGVDLTIRFSWVIWLWKINDWQNNCWFRTNDIRTIDLQRTRCQQKKDKKPAQIQ